MERRCKLNRLPPARSLLDLAGTCKLRKQAAAKRWLVALGAVASCLPAVHLCLVHVQLLVPCPAAGSQSFWVDFCTSFSSWSPFYSHCLPSALQLFLRNSAEPQQACHCNEAPKMLSAALPCS